MPQKKELKVPVSKSPVPHRFQSGGTAALHLPPALTGLGALLQLKRGQEDTLFLIPILG